MSGLVHSTPVRVRYADTDKMGVVYNGTYLQYFEIGRTELLRSLGIPYSGLEELGFQLPVLEAHIEYKAPAKYDQLLDVVTTFKPDNTAVIRLSYDVQHEGRTLALGFTRHTFVDALTWRPVRPPVPFREAISRALHHTVA